MSNSQCPINFDLNLWQSEQYDCQCDQLNPDEKCQACVYNDPNYFEEE
jgi:hypothetical protein